MKIEPTLVFGIAAALVAAWAAASIPGALLDGERSGLASAAPTLAMGAAAMLIGIERWLDLRASGERPTGQVIAGIACGALAFGSRALWLVAVSMTPRGYEY